MLDSTVSLKPELRAYILSQIADLHIERGRYGEALTKSREAIELLRQAQKEHTGEFAIAERILSDALHMEGYDEQAKKVAEQALSLARKTLDTRSPDFAFVLATLGQIVKELGHTGQAEHLSQSALQILQRAEVTQKADLATAYQNVANIQVVRVTQGRHWSRLTYPWPSGVSYHRQNIRP